MTHDDLDRPHGGTGGDDSDDDRPVYGARRRRALRIAVVVALVALVAPLVLSLASVAQANAARACDSIAAGFDRDATGSRVAFELFGPGGPGWLCYSVSHEGERLVANLGLVPGGALRPVAPDGVPT
jgi:hypothetical protein